MKLATLTHLINQEDNTTLMADQQLKVVGTKGYGGKTDGKPWKDSAVDEIGQETGKVRELRINPDQEGGITVNPEDLEAVALIDFYNGDESEVPFGDPSFRVLCCRCFKYEGGAIDTKEMRNPRWYPIDNLPKEKMIDGDMYFVPQILAGTPIKGYIRRKSDWSAIIDYKIEPCDPSELVL